MHIWQIDPVALTPYYDVSLSEALADSGHTVRYVTSPYLYDPTLQYPSNVTVDLAYFKLLSQPTLIKLPVLRKVLRGLLYPLGHKQVLQEMKRERPDIVHLQWSRFPQMDRHLAASIKRLGIPLVHTIHDVEPLFMHGLFAGSLSDVYEPYVDAFIVHTEENRTRFLERFSRIDPQKVHVIPHLALHFKKSTGESTEKREAAKVGLSINPDTFVVMFFGLIKPYKGVDVLADAIPLVLDQYPTAQFWIVGKPDSDVDRQNLATIQHRNQVHIVAEYIPDAEVAQYHQAADLMVFPYHKISQSGALVTALSFGCAVIVTNVGGLPDMVRGNGWVIPPNDPIALADAIKTAIAEPEMVAGMRARSLEFVENELAPQVIAQAHLDVYQHLIEQHKS